MRGWMAAIRRTPNPVRQISSYGSLRRLFQFFALWDVPDWTAASVTEYEALKGAKIRVGTMGLKIASIALANGATLLSRNVNDFGKVRGLQVADWLS